jgi:hypothetical protein
MDPVEGSTSILRQEAARIRLSGFRFHANHPDRKTKGGVIHDREAKRQFSNAPFVTG